MRHDRVKRPWFLWWMFPNVHVATGRFWDRYERYFQTNFPIRWKIQRDYPRKLINKLRRIKYRLGQIKWWVLHRTVDRYDVIHTGLKPAYHEITTRMLHGCFALLREHAEGETRVKGLAALEKLSVWASETDEEMYLEEHALLRWWMIERPARINPWKLANVTDEMAQNTKEFYAEQDDEMLLRLVRFRSKLF